MLKMDWTRFYFDTERQGFEIMKSYVFTLLILNFKKVMQYQGRYKKNFSSTIFLLVWLMPFLLIAQNREELTEKRQKLLSEISKASKLLTNTKKSKQAALDQYYTILRQVHQRQELVETLEQEIDLSNESIDRTASTINALQLDMDRLEQEYGEMARQTYRNKINDNKLLFLFSSEGLSDGLKRWRYIQQYDEYRKKQAALILETRASLTEKLNGMELKKVELQDLLMTTERQQDLLQKELGLKDNLLKGLKADESRISRLISRKRVAHRKLSTAIENMIAREIKSRVNKNRVNTAPTNKNTPTNKTISPSSANITASNTAFKQQKGKLAWPVQEGMITRHFGKQSHPIHKQVQITNNGIDIRATGSKNVNAIYNGQVAGIQYVPGYQNTLIIQHGDYYSVYSNLATVEVKKGMSVTSGQSLGTAGKNNQNGYSEVHLEIWKGKQRMNPAVWLRR